MTLQVVGRLRQINEAGAGGRLPTAVSAAAEMNERPKLVSRIRAASDCIWVSAGGRRGVVESTKLRLGMVAI